MKKIKSLIAIFLALILIVSNLPVRVHATSSHETNMDYLITQLPQDSDTTECNNYNQLSDFEKVMYWKISEATDDTFEIVISGVSAYTAQQLNAMAQNALSAWVSDNSKFPICWEAYGMGELSEGVFTYTLVKMEPYSDVSVKKTDVKTVKCATIGAQNGPKNKDSFACEDGNHEWQAATCYEPKRCLHCLKTEGVPFHDLGDWITLSEATCATDGKMRRDCNSCDYYEQEPIVAYGHAYTSVVTEATCTEKGYTTYTCVVCNNSYEDDFVKALGHKWQEASCDAPKLCPICGIGEGMPLGHDMGDWITVREATCTMDGEIQLPCNRCNYYEKEILPKGHKYMEAVTEATCTEKGYTTYTCFVCNDIKKGDYVNALGHKWQEAGCMEPKHCNACGAFDGMPLGHNMGDWIIIREATCTTDGKMQRACSRCNHHEQETVPANGHVYTAVIKEATCAERGSITLICMGCNDSYVDSYLEAVGHGWKDASCTEPKHCPTCGAFDGMPLGHNMGDWITLNEATCSSEGKIKRTCSRCNHYETDVIPVKEHTEVVDKAVEATCTVAGKTQGKHCSVCNTVIVSQQNIPAKGHSWKEATCTAPKTCKTCGATSGKAKGHTYNDGLDGTCNTCGIHRETTEDRTVMHMFRMYDPNSGEHFYTGSEEERENLVAAGWNYEGVGFTFSRTTGLPVHRLYDPVSGEHLYTMQQPVKTGTQYEGKDLFECEGRTWLYEGIAFNSAYDTEVPQYRLRNPNATRGAYHFTSSAEERDNLIAAGWISEGICFYSSWK